MATGKISRLPWEIREQLNRRIDEGEPGNRLVAWLNELPAVRALLAAEFDGAAIKEQNLTNWKQGGFRDWRMEQEARALVQASSGAAAVPVVTAEQLSTALAVRYLTVVREWQQSPVPTERRWRQMRVMLRDVMKLRRGEQLAERLELDWERLQFAMERFEEEKQTDDRRAMISFLAAARQWPEVGEALATAFRLWQERRGTVSEGIKVNQGEIFLKEEVQDEMAGCLVRGGDGPSPLRGTPDASVNCSTSGRGSQPQSACGAGKVRRSATDSTSYGLHNDLIQLEGEGDKSVSIKVDQGEILSTTKISRTRTRTRTICLHHGMTRHPPPQSMTLDGGEKVGQFWGAIRMRPRCVSLPNYG
jgi:hypothetical protein